jgi:prepilin-type N-terminal cleavage/methylation domain-containing protein
MTERCSAPRPRSAGFTLLEVLIAVVVFGLVMGILQEYVSESLRRLSGARDELIAGELGQTTLREVAARIERGEPVNPESGRYEKPDYMRYELTVEPYAVPLPRDVKAEQRPLSSIFVAGSDPSATPLRRIVLRVYREELGVESAVPLVAVVSIPVAQPEAQDPGAAPGAGNAGNAEVPQEQGGGSLLRRPGGGNRQGGRQ